MRHLIHLFTSLALVAGLAACAEPSEEGQEGTSEAMEFESPAEEAGIPVDTESDAARNHFRMGQQAADLGEFLEANRHFEQAVEADPEFAYGYLMVANTAASLDEFKENLDLAAQHAGGAPDGVRLMIQIGQRGLNNDSEGQLELANQLVQKYPQSARAHVTLAGIQSSMGREEESRATLMKATELDQRFIPAYFALWNSYLFTEPRDFATAERHARTVIELAPEASNAHESLGDALRAQGKLEEARDAYARSAELNPDDAVPVLKEGHINSFLGNIEEAAANYDRALSMAREGEKASFPNYKAFRHVHAGNPQAAVDELQSHLAAIDGMDVPADQKVGGKIFTLYNIAMIAIASDMFDVARQALDQRAQLMMGQAEKVGTDEFRRGQQAQIATMEGLLAAKKDDLAGASAKADEVAALVEPLKDPNRMEPVHMLKGIVALRQEKPDEAIGHLEQADQDYILVRYILARAHEDAGHAQQAAEIFREVATNNFNSVEFALLRKPAMEKAGMGAAEGMEAGAGG